jgi:hypothetical protein
MAFTAGGLDLNAQLSPHYKVKDLIVTTTGIPNNPDMWAVQELRRLAVVLELMRNRIGGFGIDSAYRSQRLQDYLKGGGQGYSAASQAASKSEHTIGIAADIIPYVRTAPVFYSMLVKDPVINKHLGQVAVKKNTVHFALKSAKHPTTEWMYVTSGGSYVRFPKSELSAYVAKYTGSGKIPNPVLASPAFISSAIILTTFGGYAIMKSLKR